MKDDAEKRPETATITVALLNAFVMQFDRGVIPAQEVKNTIFAMMSSLAGEGYSYKEVMIVLRRLREQLSEEGAATVVH